MGYGGTTAVVLLAIFYFGKVLLEKWIEKKVEHEYETKLEKFRDELRRETEVSIAQASFRYSQVYKNMAEAISQIYFKVIDLQKALGDLQVFSGTPNSSSFATASKSAIEKLGELNQYVSRNNIYIPETAAKEILHISAVLSSQYEAVNLSIDTGQGKDKHMAQHVVDVNLSMDKLLSSLRSNFQTILGIPQK